MWAPAKERLYSSFLDQLHSASARTLMLDYDGTLAPFQTDRGHAFPYPEIPPLLARIIEKGTRVVFVSGRPAREVVLLSGIHPHPEIWGSHGMERLKPDGTYHVDELSEDVESRLLQAADLLRAAGFEDRMELKTGGVALHWRGLGADDIRASEQAVKLLWDPIAAQHGMRLLEFDGGIELRDPSKDKGKAVAAILSETGPDAAIAYLGDDHTDEDAFNALNGSGLTVLVRTEYRPTAAEIWLKPPQQLVQFLEDWLEVSGEKP
jgi:trehalose 6-phosphate phosphatase